MGMAVRTVVDTVGWDRVRIAVVGGVVHEDVTHDLIQTHDLIHEDDDGVAMCPGS